MDLVLRAQWKARAYRRPNGAIRYASTPRGVKVHYLGTRYDDRPHAQCPAYVRRLQAQHMDGNGWSDIGYSFLACTHGSVYEGRGLERRNSANGNTTLNEQHYAVCALVGTAGVVTPTAPQIQGLRDAVAHCRSKGGAGWEILGHRDGYRTDCPGAALYRMVRGGELEPVSGATYTVRGGDFLSAIAKKYPGVSWQEIAAENNIPEPYTIYPGQKLRIPGTLTCTVRSGDTLSAIALRYPGVSWQQIATANRIPPPYLIRPGDVLIIPGAS
jgi:LysM repeat protein